VRGLEIAAAIGHGDINQNRERKVIENVHGDVRDAAGQSSEFLLIDHFQPYVGRIVRFEGTSYALPLLSVSSDSNRPMADWMKRQPFILIFRAPRTREWMPEATYRCHIEDGPSYTIHVAPMQTPYPEFQDYQAVFN
jgi:hypothetical protein